MFLNILERKPLLIKMEDGLNLSTVDDDSDTNGPRVNISSGKEIIYKVSHLLEVDLRHTGRGVKNDDKVRLSKSAA